jgi:sugar/nucleoside kinase (ribokinase family)
MNTPSQPAEFVGFGMLTQVEILVVDQLPEHNTGALIKDVTEFIFDDAAIVACLLRQWGVRSGLIGTAVGDDARGHNLARQLTEWGVLGEVRFSPDIKTPLEVDISDQGGARTYFWQREAHVLATLDSADLGLLQGARMLYVDWYDGDPIVRAMDEARRLGVPVFLNMEYGHSDPNLLTRYVGRADICQAVTDAAQRESSDPLQVARKLLSAGAKTALITLAGEGSLVAANGAALRVHAPKVHVVDGCGAGATFSAGFIYGLLQNWELEPSVRFATAAASLKVAHAGLQMSPVAEILSLAAEIKVERFSV